MHEVAVGMAMPAIQLHAVTEDFARSLDSDCSAISAPVGEHAELVRTVVGQTLRLLGQVPREAPFGGYLAVDVKSRQFIGACGFKTGPSASGEVEIAYFTFPSFEGQGLATEMARRLVAIARESAAVRTIIAHTLRVQNASTRILQKLGFSQAGEAQDEDAGTVWRWELESVRM